jgi:5-hydroxyisourate hydrolase
LTNSDGRAPALLPAGTALEPAVYRLTFDTATYFGSQGMRGFYPFVQVVFELQGLDHYHVPLLLSPFGYSTYRGS